MKIKHPFAGPKLEQGDFTAKTKRPCGPTHFLGCECHEARHARIEEALKKAVEALNVIAQGLITRQDGKWGYECCDTAKRALAEIEKIKP